MKYSSRGKKTGLRGPGSTLAYGTNAPVADRRLDGRTTDTVP
jgi:hypothetical protein